MHQPTPSDAPPSSFSAHLAFLAEDELDGPTPVASEYGGPTRVGSPEPEPHKLMKEDDLEKGPPVNGEEEKGEEKEVGWEISESKAPRDEEKQEEEKEVVVVLDFPEGGWRAYGAVAGAVLVLLSTFGFVMSLPFPPFSSTD